MVDSMYGLYEDTIDRVMAQNRKLCAALTTIADIAEGSQTVNSLPNIAKIARAALPAAKGSEGGNAD